jgi:hypothetical protein
MADLFELTAHNLQYERVPLGPTGRGIYREQRFLLARPEGLEPPTF